MGLSWSAPFYKLKYGVVNTSFIIHNCLLLNNTKVYFYPMYESISKIYLEYKAVLICLILVSLGKSYCNS